MNITEEYITDTTNFTSGREGNSIRNIVLHTEDGFQAGSLQRFETSGDDVSAHYLIGEDGSVIAAVREADTAYHAANWTVNLTSIGIEHEDKANPNDAVRTDAEYASSAQLVAEICTRYGIPCVKVDTFDSNKVPTAAGIVLHKEVSQEGTSCPDGLDYNRIITQAQALLGAPAGAPSTVAVPAQVTLPGGATAINQAVTVTATTLLVRSGSSTNDPTVAAHGTSDGKLHNGNVFTAVGWVYGDVVTEGGVSTNVWLVSVWGDYVWAGGTNFNYAALVVPTPAPPTPAENGTPTPQEGTPEVPAMISDWTSDVQTLYTNQATRAVDPTGANPAKPLVVNTTWDQGGTFVANSITYSRSAYSTLHNTWYGVPTTDLSPTTTPVPAATPAVEVSAAPAVSVAVDGVAAPKPAGTYSGATYGAGAVPTSETTPARLTLGQTITEFLAGLYGALVKAWDSLVGRPEE